MTLPGIHILFDLINCSSLCLPQLSQAAIAALGDVLVYVLHHSHASADLHIHMAIHQHGQQGVVRDHPAVAQVAAANLHSASVVWPAAEC